MNQPRARGLYAAKAWYTGRLSFAVAGAVRGGVSPDAFTALGVAGGLAAAALLGVSAGHPNPLWALPVGLTLAVRLAGANLDGAVARARGVTRAWGFVVNEVGDRVSDLAVMLVLAQLSGGWWGLSGLAGSTLPTFASLSVVGAGGPRLNGGPVGKTERCAIVVLVTLVAAWWRPYTVAAAVVAVGGVITAGVRLRDGAGAISGRTVDG